MKGSIALLILALATGTCAFAAAAARPDGAVIRNTGSTNFSGYTIKVWSDGRVSTVSSNRSGQPLGQPAVSSIPKNVADEFFRDLRTAKLQHPIGESCMKSASFGTTTVVAYHGWTSPDLECQGDGLVVALGSDAKKIAAAAHVSPMPARRIPMLPNEPRRGEPTPGQPSPTPEPAPSAS